MKRITRKTLRYHNWAKKLIPALNKVSSVLCFLWTQSFDLQCKSKGWFLYEMQHWVDLGYFITWKGLEQQYVIPTRNICLKWMIKSPYLQAYSKHLRWGIFAKIVHNFQPLANFTKSSTLDVTMFWTHLRSTNWTCSKLN